MERYQQIKELINSLEGDFKKFYIDGDEAAKPVIVQGMKDVEKLADEVIKDVEEKEKSV